MIYGFRHYRSGPIRGATAYWKLPPRLYCINLPLPAYHRRAGAYRSPHGVMGNTGRVSARSAGKIRL